MKILIADDEKAIRQSIRLILSDQDYNLSESEDLETTYRQILKDSPDLLLLDIHFKGKTSLELVRKLAMENIAVPIVILSGDASATEAAETIKLGAYDFIEKPISADRLRLTISRCLESESLKRHLHRMTVQNNNASEIIGKSPEIQKVKKLVDQYAGKDVKVLITGETGVGKEVIAQAIWKASARSRRPFIIVNSAAIPENLIESELFGHRKGSFTGAVSDQVGKIEMADHGTLFLDEVGDLSSGAQTKLLRFLEVGEIQKVGSNQVKKVDVRLIAATSRDLEKEMEKGHFRSDLFYRLNVARIAIPPLRERHEDIGILFQYFVESFCQKFKEPEKSIAPQALEVLNSYPWPGNIRELRNVAERAVLVSSTKILGEHLNSILPVSPARTLPETSHSSSQKETLSLRDFKNRAEKEYIESVLATANGSITRAAALLQIDRTYLHQKMTKHGIKGNEKA